MSSFDEWPVPDAPVRYSELSSGDVLTSKRDGALYRVEHVRDIVTSHAFEESTESNALTFVAVDMSEIGTGNRITEIACVFESVCLLYYPLHVKRI